MSVQSLPPPRTPKAPWRPEKCAAIVLVLQGGGALGAYQAGVYQALHEAGLEPDWVNGVSIGGINAALIAGNPPERRVQRLREFWETITARPVWLVSPDGDAMRRTHNHWSAWLTTALGQDGFFKPRFPPAWLRPRGAPGATSLYDTAPLRETLLRLIDFNLLNDGRTRVALGAVNIASGNFEYFDSKEMHLLPEHVMASGALPPGLPMIEIGTSRYWDGGLVSNTPLQHAFEASGSQSMLIFQVDLFSARGGVPRDLAHVMARAKEIQYSSRTRLTTDRFRVLRAKDVRLRAALAKVPEDKLTDEERALKEELAHLSEVSLVHLIYRHTAYEGAYRDFEFSALSMHEHWNAGYRDTERTLLHKDWLKIPPPDVGLTVHDVHRTER